MSFLAPLVQAEREAANQRIAQQQLLEERAYREAAARQAHKNALAVMAEQDRLRAAALQAEQERQDAIARGGLVAMSQNPALADMFLPYQEAEFDPSAFSGFTPEAARESGMEVAEPLPMDGVEPVLPAVYPSREEADAAIANMTALSPADFSNLSDAEALGAYNAISAMAPTMMQTAATEEAARIRAATERAKREQDRREKVSDREYGEGLKLKESQQAVLRKLYAANGAGYRLDPFTAKLLKSPGGVSMVQGMLDYSERFDDPENRAIAELYMTRMEELNQASRRAVASDDLGTMQDVAAEYEEQATDLHKSLLESNTKAAGYFLALTQQRQLALKKAAARHAKANDIEGDFDSPVAALEGKLKKNPYAPKLAPSKTDPGEPKPPAKPDTREAKAAALSVTDTREQLGKVMGRMVKTSSGNVVDLISETARTIAPGKAGTGSEVNKLALALMGEYDALDQPIPESELKALESVLVPLEQAALERSNWAKKNPVWNVISGVNPLTWTSGLLKREGGWSTTPGVSAQRELDAVDAARAVIDRLREFNTNKEYLKQALAPTPQPKTPPPPPPPISSPWGYYGYGYGR